MRDYDWYHELGIATEVNWRVQGDEFLHHISECVADALPGAAVASHQLNQETMPFIELRLERAPLPLHTEVVLLAVGDNEVRFFAAGNGDPIDETEWTALSAALRNADGRIGEQGSEHVWTAVIGPSPKRIGGAEKRLRTASKVGLLRIEPGTVVFVEPETRFQKSMSAWGIQRSMPMHVSGSSRGYAWESAQVAAARDLHTLCGLLSVCWATPIEVRESAWQDGHRGRSIPSRPSWYKPFDPAGNAEPSTVGEEVDLPAWLDDAWRVVNDKQTSLRRALDAYSEGAYAAQEHPSLAVIALAGCVEVVAGKVFKLPRCPDCGETRGHAESFRRTIRLVASDDQAAMLVPLYTHRSKTAHAGHFHGGETTPGVLRMGVWSASPGDDFRWRLLWSLLDVARQLLVMAFRGLLPARTDLDLPAPERDGGV